MSVVAQSFHIFGLRAGVTNNVCYNDEQTIIFPSGNNCVRYNVDQKWQKFIPGSEKSQGIIALAISPNRRYLAVSERGDRGTITVYDLQHDQSKKRKVLSAGDAPVQEFLCMAFSPDSKYLIGQAGAPDWNLFYWMWEKQKVMAAVKSTNPANPVYQISFNPRDNTQVCVTGSGVFKLFRYTEGSLKQTNAQRLDAQNYLSHAWVTDDRIIVGTDNGRLLLFEGGDLRWETHVVPKPSTRDSDRSLPSKGEIEQSIAAPRITAVATYSKGFACSAGLGTVCVFEKTEEKDNYRRAREIQIPQDQHSYEPSNAEHQEILTLCISPSEETLLASTDHCQLYSIALSSAEIKGEQAQFEFLSYCFHSGVITGLDGCIRKPLIATCSLDRSVRIWNFETRSLELYKEFQEEAYSVALHPSGLYVLVGFLDKLRLMNLLIDDIRIFKEFTVRGCRECSFSHGGHLFAAVNGNVIHIYSTTTFENILNLKGHNGKVRSVVWSPDDSRLVSCGMDGAVYEWNTLTGKRESECVLKSCSYTGITMSPDAKAIFAVGSDLTLKEIADSQILREIQSDVSYTSIVMSHSGRMLFVGTSAGTIRSMKYPLPIQKEWNECYGHAAPITKMTITYDDQFLLTVSEDGCLLIWKIIDKEGRGLKSEKEVTYAEEILITKSDLEEKNQIMLELKTRVEELKMENEYQLRLKDMNYNEKIKELTEKFIQEMEALKTKSQVLKSEMEKQQLKYTQEMVDLIEKQSKEQQDLESANNQKLMLEYEKYQELQTKSQRMQEEYEKQLHELEESKSLALEDLTEYYETKIQEKQTTLEQCQDESRQQVREFEETIKQVEEDGDREMLDIKTKFESQVKEEKKANLLLKGETGIMKKKLSSLQKDIEDRNFEIEKLKLEQQKLQEVIKSLEKDITGLKKEIQERDETIQDKEKRIYDLKKKNQELEKFKFVLDYKIKELKKQIEPRENEIKEMKEQIQEMEEELERFHSKNTQLELNITELQQKLKATNKEKQKEMQRVRDVEALVKRFKTDLHNCVGFIQEPKKLKDTICELYDRYVHQSDVVEIVGVDADIQREFARQREHLERSVGSLQKKLVKDTDIHRAENIRIMQENVSLIKEINDLRRELKMVRSSAHDQERAKISRKQFSSDLKGSSLDNHISPVVARINFEEEAERIMDLQKLEIQRLRDQIQAQEQSYPLRPPSGGKLPAITT
ncbi:cilia- and flagella-associated protein 57 [Erpetoichthys calabaricus]|uniref:cilia- and flagella-associated protein 57 n=1 Tax=Erpetoichthys calabaricus TaxID=27687 RepID=UPI00109F3F8E|nr:cilia- and flagella-associated protein 57 [Erpetoichthys calabaricus]